MTYVGANLNTVLAKDQHCVGNHVETEHVVSAVFDGNYVAMHCQFYFVVYVIVDENCVVCYIFG